MKKIILKLYVLSVNDILKVFNMGKPSRIVTTNVKKTFNPKNIVRPLLKSPHVSVRIPENVDIALTELLELGLWMSQSEIIRNAIIDYYVKFYPLIKGFDNNNITEEIS